MYDRPYLDGWSVASLPWSFGEYFGQYADGAVNAFNGKTNSVLNQLNGKYEAVSAVAKQYKAKGISSIVVAEENYGEGSSREHAAMEPRFLNVKVILAKASPASMKRT